MKRKLKIDYRHFICVFLTIGFILCSIYVFPFALFRLTESFKDFGLSIAYYFTELFEFGDGVIPTVNNLSEQPFEMPFGLPSTWEEFKVVWGEYWVKWKSSENFDGYVSLLSDIAYNLSRILLLLFPLIFVCIISFNKYFETQNNDYDKESKALKIYKKIVDVTYTPIKKWIISFCNFLNQYNFYLKIWMFIWAFNFNFITIFIEFLAFYFYFVVSFDFINIYRQVYKLLFDLSPMLDFVPLFIWAIVAYVIFDIFRKNVGYNNLNHMERKNCGVIKERPIVSFIVGLMGKKKTTTLTDMALSGEVLLRSKAFELILECDLKFPNFPWQTFENNLKYAMEKHYIYNLATIRKYIRHLRFLYTFKSNNNVLMKGISRRLKKYHLDIDVPLFGYDYERYGLDYNDGLKVVDIWEVLEDYAQLYFIYVVYTSIIISNFSVRSDVIKNDIGNFPLWDNDFFSRDARYQDSYSRHAHILDFDMLRLGKKVVPDNPKANFFEFGVVLITEVGKERKNSQTLLEVKIRELFANQKNDGFNDSLKMIRHSATVCNFPFVKILTDEQRPSSWGADAKELCEILHIQESYDTQLAMPFFNLYTLVYTSFLKKFENLYYKYRFNRADSTLPMYLIKNLFWLMHKRYVRIYNTFGYCKLKIGVEAGVQDGNIQTKYYYLMFKKIYSKRFSSDCFSDFYYTRALRSDIGIHELEEYQDVKATVKELEMQNSYFIQDLMDKHNIDKD